MKKFFIIFGILVVLLIVAAVVFIGVNRNKLMATSFAAIQPAVMQQLPQSVPADSARALFDQAIEKIRAGETNPLILQDFFATFKSSMEDQQIDSTEVGVLLEKMQAF